MWKQVAQRTVLWSGAAIVSLPLAARLVEHQQCDSHSPTLPRVYDQQQLFDYWKQRPYTTLKRLTTVGCELVPLGLSLATHYHWGEQSLNDMATAQQVVQTLTRLGPAFVKLGQQLSIRPDLVPPVFVYELQKLCDEVEPVADECAMEILKQQLQLDDLQSAFGDEPPKRVAAASLGQVYKGIYKDREVAIKVQRPHMLEQFSLDLYLLQQFGRLVDLFTSLCTNQAPFHQQLYENFARGSYSELDYEMEGRNQVRFQRELKERKCPVKIPDVLHATQTVLITEWMDGIKLANAPPEVIRELIPVGVELFLVQLLDLGSFHADPHVGNLLVSPDNELVLLDFGLVAEIDAAKRKALLSAIYSLLTKDYNHLVGVNAKELGFLPHDLDVTELQPVITKIIRDGLIETKAMQRSSKFMEISNELNAVFFEFPFSVPPFFALITRGLGILEGIALSADPNFDIFRASAPYARRRAMQVLGTSALRLTRRRTVAE